MDRYEALVARLNEYKNEGLRFYDAKQRLLAEGYGEQEIGIAVGQVPFRDDDPATQTVLPEAASDPYSAPTKEAAEALLRDEAAKRTRRRLSAFFDWRRIFHRSPERGDEAADLPLAVTFRNIVIALAVLGIISFMVNTLFSLLVR